MSQGDQFHQYGYDHYLKAPKKSKLTMSQYESGRIKMSRGFQSPALATIALLAAAVLFVGVVYVTYPAEDQTERPIPVVKAKMVGIKEKPQYQGGMPIPNRDSAVLARNASPILSGDKKKIENLLDRKRALPSVNKEEAINSTIAASDRPAYTEKFKQTVNSSVAQEIPLREGSSKVPTLLQETQAVEYIETPSSEDILLQDELKERTAAVDLSESYAPQKIIIKPKQAFEVEVPSAKNVLQKIGASDVGNTVSESSPVFQRKVALAAVKEKPYKAPSKKTQAQKPQSADIHDAGTSPDTIAYVRSVLTDSPSKAPQDIEPAAGVTVATKIEPGSFYVQLASITDASRAKGEFMKMTKKYNVLNGSNFRVQEASLNSGQFFRIQAGPMSKTSADNICASLKNAKKPGGCLVVK